MPKSTNVPCSLCGEMIDTEPADERDALSMEHVPPKQFHPKSMREELAGELWKVPSHVKCNQSYKLDEEYFYHYFYPLVGVQNPQMGQALLDDLRRRAKKPQSKGLIRRMLGECTNVSPGGIILPPTLVRVNFDIVRIQRVVVKIAQCIFYKDHGRFLPRAKCDHIEMCENPSDVQEIYALLCGGTEKKAVMKEIFCYWHEELDGTHLYSLLFWESFMFCLGFQEPTT